MYILPILDVIYNGHLRVWLRPIFYELNPKTIEKWKNLNN